MEKIQIIEEKEMKSKLLKQFLIRTFTYSLIYFAAIVIMFIFEPMMKNVIFSILLILAANILFLMLISKLATTDAFDGINTTTASKKSLNRISHSASIPLFVFTSIISFIDIIFLHSILDVSKGYTTNILGMFFGLLISNVFVWIMVTNIYEKRILKKYLTLED